MGTISSLCLARSCHWAQCQTCHGPVQEMQKVYQFSSLRMGWCIECHRGVTELSPTYVVNNEGLLVRAQFSQDAAGTWAASDLAWAPSVMVRGPYRWCSVAADAPQGPCAGTAADAATRQRTKSVLESRGAAAAGAHELLITGEP